MNRTSPPPNPRPKRVTRAPTTETILQEILTRVTRSESRLVRLMKHAGMKDDGRNLID